MVNINNKFFFSKMITNYIIIFKIVKEILKKKIYDYGNILFVLMFKIRLIFPRVIIITVSNDLMYIMGSGEDG